MGFLRPKASKSDNLNRDLINRTYGSTMQQGVGANNFLSALLTGQGDVAGARAGLKNYLDMTGFAPAMRQLSQNVTGQGAASGLLRSGPTARRLMTLGTELNQQLTNNYLQQLFGLSNQGLQAGNLVTSAGQRSVGGRPSTAGSIASAIGGITSIFRSDRRLKTDIEKVGEFDDGLGIYEFRYLGEQDRVRGVMADEVAEIRPWALGPKIKGFATVNYGDL